MGKIFSRLGDGWPLELTEVEHQAELKEGSEFAVYQGKVKPLHEDELTHLFDICRTPNRMLGVERGIHVVLFHPFPRLQIKSYPGLKSNKRWLRLETP